MTEELVAVAGGELWTASAGSGPPVVLAHGGPGMSNTLEPVAAMVGDIARVHLYDQRGCGRSTAGPPYDIATFIEDLEALREHWGHERWVVGGHSWGAALALFYALAHPDRTAAVIYLSGTAVRWGWAERVMRERLRRLRPDERAELETLDRADPRRPRLLWLTDFAGRERAERVLAAGPLFAHPRNLDVARAIDADWQARLDAGIEDGVRALPMPVLVLHGSHDIDPVGAPEIAGLAPRGELAVVEDAGHLPWLEQPDAVRRSLRAFLRARGS